MARRTQLLRPTLCGFGCVIEQEWDDADPVPQPRPVRFLARCDRHRALPDAAAHAAIEEESDRFNGVAALLEAQGRSPVDVGARIAEDGALEVTMPEGQPAPPGLLKGVRFK